MTFEELVDNVEDLVSELTTIGSKSSKMARVSAEQEEIGSFMETAADMAAAGDVSESDIGPLLDAIKDESEFYNKTELRGLFKEKLEESDVDDDDERPEFDEWIEGHLEQVLVVETTDKSRPVTTYTWDFGPHGTAETRRDPSSGVTHLSWHAFRERVYEAVGMDFAPPEAAEAEEWRAWIEPIIRERRVRKQAVGARTHAIEHLESHIVASVGYLTPSDAVSRGGVWIDATDDAVDDDASGAVELDDDDINAIGVPNSAVRSAKDEAGAESFRAVQNEVDARGISADDTTGVSRVVRVGEDSQRFWVFDPSFARPPTIRVAGRDPTDATTPTTPGMSVGGGASTTGISTSIGTDPDAETDGGAIGDATDTTDDATDTGGDAT